MPVDAGDRCTKSLCRSESDSPGFLAFSPCFPSSSGTLRGFRTPWPVGGRCPTGAVSRSLGSLGGDGRPPHGAAVGSAETGSGKWWQRSEGRRKLPPKLGKRGFKVNSQSTGHPTFRGALPLQMPTSSPMPGRQRPSIHIRVSRYRFAEQDRVRAPVHARKTSGVER